MRKKLRKGSCLFMLLATTLRNYLWEFCLLFQPCTYIQNKNGLPFSHRHTVPLNSLPFSHRHTVTLNGNYICTQSREKGMQQGCLPNRLSNWTNRVGSSSWLSYCTQHILNRVGWFENQVWVIQGQVHINRVIQILPCP